MTEPDTLAYDALDPAAKPYVDAAAKALYRIDKGLGEGTDTPFDAPAPDGESTEETEGTAPEVLADYRDRALRVVRALSAVHVTKLADAA